MKSTSSRSQGFTLLEAIVAMVIVSVLSMTLYSWLNQSFLSSVRAVDALNRADAVMSARSFIENLNPMMQQQGMYQLGEYFIRWNSVPVTEIVPLYDGGSVGPYDVALFRVDVDLFLGLPDNSEKLVGAYSLELIGYSRTRDVVL